VCVCVRACVYVSVAHVTVCVCVCVSVCECEDELKLKSSVWQSKGCIFYHAHLSNNNMLFLPQADDVTPTTLPAVVGNGEWMTNKALIRALYLEAVRKASGASEVLPSKSMLGLVSPSPMGKLMAVA
jgi:hypothetical protein